MTKKRAAKPMRCTLPLTRCRMAESPHRAKNPTQACTPSAQQILRKGRRRIMEMHRPVSFGTDELVHERIFG